ncbi:hypothetical protein L7F22_065010 [Adiantum nelumboides]|nr:hypothetical protein [Adiantum nelumboides]
MGACPEPRPAPERPTPPPAAWGRGVEGLDPEQHAAVTAPRGPVCVLAGAGTGKTRTITRRIAHLVADGHVAPGQVLAVTFTARAAGELRTRLRALDASGVQARTFHAAALRQLRYFWPRVVGGPHWQLVEGKLRIIGQAAARARAGTDSDALRDLASEIEWAKSSLVSPSDYPAEAARRKRDTPGPAEQVAAVYAAYEELKNAAEVLDFDDLLLHTAVALEEHAGVADEFRSRYRCFVVDEYQDVTPLQQRLLDAWLGERDDLTVVGDANQTIYTFAGASPRYLLDFPRRFPEATVVRLQRDYRSTPQIVSSANQLIAGARNRPAGSPAAADRAAPAGPGPGLLRARRRAREAAAVAGRIKTLVADGTPPSEIAILFRINAQSEAYEQALTELGLPYQVRGGERFFARQEVRRAMIALRGAAPDQRPGTDMVTVTRAVLTARAGLTDEPPQGATARAQWESLLALVGLAEELAGRRAGGGPGPVGRRAGHPRRRRAPAGRAGRHAGLAARGEGAGVGRGVPGRAGRRHAADPARRGRRDRDRGGTPAVLRRHHPGPPGAVDVVGAGPGVGTGAPASPEPVPARPDPGLAPGVADRGGAPTRRGPAQVPGLRHAAVRHGGDEAPPLRRLPLRRRPRAAGPAQAVAGGRGQGAERPGLRGAHRRHPHRDRRAAPGRPGVTGRYPGHRRGQTGPLRRAGPRTGGRGELTAPPRPAPPAPPRPARPARPPTQRAARSFNRFRRAGRSLVRQ